MRKPSLLLVFLLLVALVHTEVPELMHLSNIASNDFGTPSFGCQSVQVRAASHAKAPVAASAQVPAAVYLTVQNFYFLSVARSFRGAGKDFLRMCPILRT